ncbi:protein Exd1 homolog [Teleopsis dalmanni]|uniref:protein Exd1 homolog n=1 Tax=Teleopsis dalmanni TaxID=139649 RepID=UPI0018CFC970|nr:protein Exd1 homolog [Teleopsis dalmanni]
MEDPRKVLKNLKIGQIIMAETELESIIAKILCLSAKSGFIELENVRNLKTNYVYATPQIYTFQQIISIKIVADEESNKDTSSSMPASSPEQYSKRKEIESKYNLSNWEINAISQQLASVTVIYQCSQSYYASISDIKMQSVIGLVVEPVSGGRNNRTSIIAICTQKNVYIYDITSMGKLMRDLRQILEASRPKKAVHYSHLIGDHMVHRHQLQLAGLFDTYVVHKMLTNCTNSLSLLELLKITFCMPEQYFKNEIKSNTYLFDVQRRPLEKNITQQIALKVVFQLKLYEILVHKSLLAHVFDKCSHFSKRLTETESSEAVMLIQPGNTRIHDEIQPDEEWTSLLNLLNIND